ncbi:glyoxylase-like metal-dependent hydrolase (beta-lactamase superfamily II) [Bacillus ectoiniformans]|uniref:MBL fold metallo-hydrolase n=1 Tax=Bacillus ectoiniformans TaxID=1494429 RepID=UPI001956C214|nr:MBL fold metallo-hydrolase [Bacillus ectoiniformans]MBM7647839.1 glyoxylase-like metal-dependent hydrolase (beta-lactamase superfamily II) [Bacillus ectoiniformans]
MDKHSNKHLQIGRFHCIALSDGVFSVSKDFFFANTPKDLIEHIPDPFQAPLNFLFIDTGEKKVLVDTGLGQENTPVSGLLLNRLQEEGISPQEVDAVIITHGHLDHIGGVSHEGDPVFPNANYYIRDEEWSFWENQKESREFEKLKPIENQTIKVFSDFEIYPGILVNHTPGHTEGHLTVSIQSEGDSLIVASDILSDPCVLNYSPSHIAAEVSPAKGLQTRTAFLEKASEQAALLFVCHYPFPGLGYIEKNQLENGWEWVPYIEKGK